MRKRVHIPGALMSLWCLSSAAFRDSSRGWQRPFDIAVGTALAIMVTYGLTRTR